MSEEEKKPRLSRAERLAAKERKVLLTGKSRMRFCLKHREEAYDIGGASQVARLAKQGKKPMRDLITMLIDPGTDLMNWDSMPAMTSARNASTAARFMTRKNAATSRVAA